jgi:protein TonB
MKVQFALIYILLFSSHLLFCQSIDSIKTINDSSNLELKIAPVFPGGNDAFLNYMRSNLNPTSDSSFHCDHRTVNAEFTVDTLGNVSEVKILRGCDSSIDNQIIRALNNMPKWIPGKENERIVNTRFSIPIYIKWQ